MVSKYFKLIDLFIQKNEASYEYKSIDIVFGDYKRKIWGYPEFNDANFLILF